jgi:plastocyanin
VSRARGGVALAGAIVVVTLLGGCGGSASGNSTQASAAAPSTATNPPAATASQPPASSGSSATKPQAGVFVIHIRNYAYVPAAPVVRVGQRIEIINDDVPAHTWSAAPKSNWSYTSGNLEKGQHVTFAGFTKPGRYPFLCFYHAEMPSMNGTITATAH